jgi:phage terminase small subunit
MATKKPEKKTIAVPAKKAGKSAAIEQALADAEKSAKTARKKLAKPDAAIPASKKPTVKAKGKAKPKAKPKAKAVTGKPATKQPAKGGQSVVPDIKDPTQELADKLGLTSKQKRFADEWLIDFNGTQAAIRAKYSAKTANEQAAQLLAKLSIKKYIDARKAELSEKLGLTQELVRKQWLGILTTDANDLVEFRRTCCRYCYGKDNLYQRTAREMDRDQERHKKEVEKAQVKAALKGGDIVVEPFDEQGGTGYIGIKDPNPACPECWGEGVGDVFFKDTRKLSPEAKELYAGAEIGKDGIKIKTNSKDHAREMVAKHLTMFEEKVEVTHKVASIAELDRVYEEQMAEMEQRRSEIIARKKATSG